MKKSRIRITKINHDNTLDIVPKLFLKFFIIVKFLSDSINFFMLSVKTQTIMVVVEFR